MMLRSIYPIILAITVLAVSFGCGKQHDENPFGWEEDYESDNSEYYNSFIYETIPIPQIDWMASLQQRPYLKEIVDSVIGYYMEGIENGFHETQEQWEARVEDAKRFLEEDSPLPYFIFEVNDDAERLLRKCRLLDNISGTLSSYFQLFFMCRANTLEEDIERFKQGNRIEIYIKKQETCDSTEKIYVQLSERMIDKDNINFIEHIAGGGYVGGIELLIINSNPTERSVKGIVTYPDSMFDLSVFTAPSKLYVLYELCLDGTLHWEYEVCNGKLQLKYFGY